MPKKQNPEAVEGKCNFPKKEGTLCKLPPIRGGTVCHKRGGRNKRVKARAAVRAEVMAWGLGEAHDDPGEVLLRLVTQSRKRADLYALLAAGGF